MSYYVREKHWKYLPGASHRDHGAELSAAILTENRVKNTYESEKEKI